jgi:Disulphide bond corrector protein DsbC
MRSTVTIRVAIAAATIGLASVAAAAQIVSPDAPPHHPITQEAVAFLSPEQITVPAGKPSPVAMHFRIAQGLHINSHTPSGDSLIPTVFSIPADRSVRLETAGYPDGTDITLALDPKTKLSVYTGDFTITARIVSTPGHHTVDAKLRYQACDRNECMPPKTISVPIDVTAN